MRAVVICVTVSLLLIACSSTGDVLFDSLYSTSISNVEDIRGNFTVETFLLSREGTMSVNRYIITIKRIYSVPGNDFFTIEAIYDGQGWIFAEEFHLRTDSELYTFVDNDPYRDIISGGRVKEVLSAPLSETQVADLLSTERLTVQFKNMVEVPPEGISELKEFLSAAKNE